VIVKGTKLFAADKVAGKREFLRYFFAKMFIRTPLKEIQKMALYQME